MTLNSYLLITEYVEDDERPSTSGLQSCSYKSPPLSSSSDSLSDVDDVILTRRRLSACVPVSWKQTSKFKQSYIIFCLHSLVIHELSYLLKRIIIMCIWRANALRYYTIICDPTRHDNIWHDTTRHDTILYDNMWPDTTIYNICYKRISIMCIWL